MDFLNEFKYALKDGLGRNNAHLYALSIFNELPNAALAYSAERNELLLLLLPGPDFQGLTGDEYLDAAKTINRALGCFSAPNQKIGPHLLWGGKTQGPVHVYQFKVFNHPQRKCTKHMPN